jgi:hypothetical protein
MEQFCRRHRKVEKNRFFSADIGIDSMLHTILRANISKGPSCHTLKRKTKREGREVAWGGGGLEVEAIPTTTTKTSSSFALPIPWL